MSNYDLSSLGTSQSSLSPYLTYGSDQILKVTDIELKFSKNTGSPKGILHMETKPFKADGFSPVEGAKGKVGKVACGVYMKDEFSKKVFLQKMKTIAIAMGLEEEINEIKGDSFETIVKSIQKIFVGEYYAKYTICAEEYEKPGGKIGLTLMLPRLAFVEAIDANPSTIVAFDKNNPYHYKKLPEKAKEEQFNSELGSKASSVDVSDLPF